ncbi:hypothetical protein GA0115242_13146 [Streptomyces sp. SolWspMP-5a-2]|nr:hypothetical protein GA0115242_13146 [Streptomyces sp. SolWspMP-5a-2]
MARQAAGGMTVVEIAGDWKVRVERVEEVLAHSGTPEPDDTPVTTIASRLAHLHGDFAGRWEWTFGGRRRDPRTLVDFAPDAASALDAFWTSIDRWRDSVATVTDAQLDTVGFSRHPYGSDPHDPHAAVPAGFTLEFIHHMAEIALLRDLYRAGSGGSR